MLKRFSIIICALAMLTGCHEKQQLADPLALGPDPNAITVTDSCFSRAIAATGGYKAWINTKKLELDCIVTFWWWLCYLYNLF